MFGLIISLALASVVVITSITAIRRGEIELGERTVRRPEPLFWAVTVGGALVGMAIMMVSLRAYLEVSAEASAPPKTLERNGIELSFPASWDPLPHIEEAMGTGPQQAFAVGGNGAELLVLWPPSRATDEPATMESLRTLAKDLKSDTFDYASWKVDEGTNHVVVDADYRSPRGMVVSRHILHTDAEGAIHMVVATCSTEREVAACRGVVDSIVFTGGR